MQIHEIFDLLCKQRGLLHKYGDATMFALTPLVTLSENATPSLTMSANATVLKRTFALTTQRQEGTVVLLEVQAKVRKIPATIIADNEDVVHIQTDPSYLPELEESETAIPKTEEESRNSEDIPQEEARACQTLVIDLTLSDDEEESEENESDTTEVNPDLPREFPHDDVEQPPPLQEEERPCSTETGRIPSPAPPCYLPPQHFQNMYAPPIFLHSEQEYFKYREDLIQQYLRDSLDLYYKYEFQAIKLKRARNLLTNRKY